MRVGIASSNTWLGNLRHRFQHAFPRLLHAPPAVFTQNLLSEDEINELRLRVLSQQQKPLTHSRDTTNQRMGDNRSTHRGYGMDYEESRAYQAGDDPRYLNWALSARTGELHTKMFREERRPGVFIVIDRRNSMRFGTRIRPKVAQAVRIAACLAFSAEQRNASIGGAILNAETTKLDWLKESGDKQTSLALIHAANTPCLPIDTKPDLAFQACRFSDALSMLQASLSPGSQLFLISDFIDIDKSLSGQLLQLASEHSVHAIHISDPVEKNLPQIGNVQFQSEEDEQPRLLNTQPPELQQRYTRLAEKHFADRKQLFQNLGIRYTAISTAEDGINTILNDC